MSRRLANAALVLASTLGALLVAELALRLTDDALILSQERFSFRWMVYDPVLSWRNVPGTWVKKYHGQDGVRSERLRINSHGFRGGEIASRKPESVTRVVCMGDSVTFGMINNPVHERGKSRMIPIASSPGALSRLLEREAPRRFEVINAGVVGYSSSHGLRQFVLRLLDLEPDVVTVRFGVNDTLPSWAPWHRSYEPSNVLVRELLYRLSDLKLTRLTLAAYRSVRFLHPEPGSVRWAPPERYRRNLERIIEVARRRGIRVLLLDYPLAPVAQDAEVEADRRSMRRELAKLGNIARAVSGEQNVPLLETGARFAAHERPLFDEADFIHPNHRGAEVLARLIAERLREPWPGR